jgi:Phage tail lysozyme
MDPAGNKLAYTSTEGTADAKKGNYPPSLVYQIVMNEAQRRGMSWFKQHHALAMMGSFIQETGNFRKDVVDFNVRGDGGSAHGLMQWRGARMTNLQEYAKRTGLPAQDIRAQVSFAFEEGTPGSPFADPGSVRAFRDFPQAKGVEDATVMFIHAERPAGYSSNNPGAANDAQKRVSHAMGAGKALQETGMDEALQNYDFTSDGQYGNVSNSGASLSYDKPVGTESAYSSTMRESFGVPPKTDDRNVNDVDKFVSDSAAFADQVTKGRQGFSYSNMFGME